MSARLMVCMLLLGASLPVVARDAVTDPAADTPCPPTATAPQAEQALDTGHARRAPAAGSASKVRPAASGGGDSEGPARGPRWHSFLPGMFR
ncbi:conserved exported hypothetical protein [Luteimonas sp. 9C]|uniref:hypothetical protein n=1 Tax=Luteimonas sp. 9C TaxID=2653148 RepID=UPI0012F01DA8|nr:hypothetical protein [Luteimonas sp. 9C]VXA92458.1 conserved exported hypothetical protein [Luteimonas sp. 9C]